MRRVRPSRTAGKAAVACNQLQPTPGLGEISIKKIGFFGKCSQMVDPLLGILAKFYHFLAAVIGRHSRNKKVLGLRRPTLFGKNSQIIPFFLSWELTLGSTSASCMQLYSTPSRYHFVKYAPYKVCMCGFLLPSAVPVGNRDSYVSRSRSSRVARHFTLSVGDDAPSNQPAAPF